MVNYSFFGRAWFKLCLCRCYGARPWLPVLQRSHCGFAACTVLVSLHGPVGRLPCWFAGDVLHGCWVLFPWACCIVAAPVWILMKIWVLHLPCAVMLSVGVTYFLCFSILVGSSFCMERFSRFYPAGYSLVFLAAFVS